MPEINYNNPEFEGTLDDKYSGVYSNSASNPVYPSDMFINNYTYSAGSGGGTCSLDVCLTTFAQQGFLILLSITGLYIGFSQYIGIDGITVNYNTVDIKDSETGQIVDHAGTFSIPANTNRLSQRTAFFLQEVKILSYRKRYLRFNTDDLTITIHPSDGTSNFSLLAGLKMNSYTLSGNLLGAHNCFSINTDEGAFYTPQSGITYDIDEFPIGKDNDNNYGSRNVTGSVKSYLKNRGSHFLFNQSNEFQKRDFSLIDNADNPLKGNSDSQNYVQIGTVGGDNKIVQAYTITNNFNQIMRKKTKYNQTASQLQMPNYQYFNNDIDSNQKYYTDLWDNNKGPMMRNPLKIYDNFLDTHINDSIVLTSSNLSSYLFGVDKYTLYFQNQVYYIPLNGKIGIYRSYGTTSPSINSQETSPFYHLRLSASDKSGAQLYGGTDDDDNLIIFSTNEVTSQMESGLLTKNNKLNSYTDGLNICTLTTKQGKISYNIFAQHYFYAGALGMIAKICNNIASAETDNKAKLQIKGTIIYNSFPGTICNTEMSTTDLSYRYESGNSNYTNYYKYTNNTYYTLFTSARRDDGSTAQYRAVLSLSCKMPYGNGIGTKSSVGIGGGTRSTATFNNYTIPYYYYGYGYGTGDISYEYGAGVEVSSNNIKDEAFTIIAYGPDGGTFSLTSQRVSDNQYTYKGNSIEGVKPAYVLMINGGAFVNLPENGVSSKQNPKFTYFRIIVQGSISQPTQYFTISSEQLVAQNDQTIQYHFIYNNIN